MPGVGGEAARMSLRVIGFGPTWESTISVRAQTTNPLGENNLTKIKFPISRFPRQQARKALHLVAADLVMIDVIVVAVTKGPEVVCLVFPLDLAKSMCRRRRGGIEDGAVEMFGFDLDVQNTSDEVMFCRGASDQGASFNGREPSE